MYHKQQWQDSGQSQRDAKKSSVCLGTSFPAVGLARSWITTPRASSSRITSRRICLNASRCSSARIALTRKSLRWFGGICCSRVQARRWSGILSCGRKTYCGRFTSRSPRPERAPKRAQNRWRSPRSSSSGITRHRPSLGLTWRFTMQAPAAQHDQRHGVKGRSPPP